MRKVFYTQDNIGTAKYTVSFHDGISTHRDGSKFFGIATFRNKKKYHKYIRELRSSGYGEISSIRLGKVY